MSTRITVEVGKALLAQTAKALAEQNRQSRLDYESRLKEYNALRAASLKAAAEDTKAGKAPSGTAAPGTSTSGTSVRNDVPEYYTPPKVAAQASTGIDFAFGWIVKQSNSTTQIVSGNGAVSAPFVADGQSIVDAAAAASPYTTELTIDPTTEFTWNAWGHRETAVEITPSDTSVWYRYRPCTEVAIAMSPEFCSYGRAGDLVFPLGKNLIYTRGSNANWYRRDYLLTASTAVDYSTTPPYADMIWTYEEVAGSALEDPDTLLEDPTRLKYLRINIDAPITVDDDQEINLSYDTFKSYSVSATSVREVTAPAAVRTRFDEIYGVAPVPSTQLVGASTGGPTLLRSVASLTINGVNWSNVQVYSIDSFSGYTRRDPNVSQGGDESLDRMINEAPAACFGLGVISPDNAEMNNSQALLATPLIYRLMDGAQTYTIDDFYGDLETLSACLEGLAPLPRGIVWINTQPGGVSLPDLYLAVDQVLAFDLFTSSASNAVEGGQWYDFAGDGKPTQRGQLRGTLRPLPERIAPSEDYPDETKLLFATPYRDGAYCRTKLLELGFTAADLVP